LSPHRPAQIFFPVASGPASHFPAVLDKEFVRSTPRPYPRNPTHEAGRLAVITSDGY